MVAEKKICDSLDAEDAGAFTNVTGCQHACMGRATMISFGRIDGTKCFENGTCRCYCERSATANGTCEYSDHHDYDLYQIKNSTGKYYYSHFIV